MSIKKITQSEIMESGVTSLPTRPSTPSLYSGQSLSASELRRAFDRLPTLIAERFNALLDATGLFDGETEAESLAALIATDLSDGHSLADLFSDIGSGALATYLSADGARSLRTLLDEIEAIIALPEGYETLKQYIDDPQGKIEDGERLPVSGDAVAACIRAERELLLERLAEPCPVLLEEAGEGDIVSSLSAKGNVLTVHKDMSSQALYAAACAYADAPKGSVTETETKPVSGKAVRAALDALPAFDQIDALDARIDALESAAAGQLYTFTEVDSLYASSEVPKRSLASAVPLRIGGAINLSSKNLFPEYAVKAYPNNPLTVTWDEDEGCLVFNGSLSAGLQLLAFLHIPAKKAAYTLSLFYRSGTVFNASDYDPVFCLNTSEWESFLEVPITQASTSTLTTTYAGTSPCFERLCLYSAGDISFHNYKCNLQLEEGLPTDYKAFCGAVKPAPPLALTSYGRNHWTGETTALGVGSVTLPAKTTLPAGPYTVSMYVKSTDLNSEKCLLIASYENGRRYSRQISRNARISFPVTFSSGVTAVTVYAGTTETGAQSDTVKIEDLQISKSDACTDFVPHRAPVTLTLPASLTSFPYCGLGIDESYCNYIDFEKSVTVSAVRAYDFTGEEAWQLSTFNTFFLPITLEDALLASGSYTVTSLFTAADVGTTESETLTLSADGITVRTYKVNTLDDFCDLLSHTPISLVYAVTPTRGALDAEAIAFTGDLFFPAEEGSEIVLTTEGEDTAVFSRILYQIKNTEVS